VCKATPAPVLCNWFSKSEPAPSFSEFEQLGVRVALYPVMAAQAGLQGAWELMNAFKVQGPDAITSWQQRAAAGPYGMADYKRLTGHGDVRPIEDQFLPGRDRRDYGAKR
jgi:2-methylisocitrate lyase-like PEP mutase family enzyme